MFEETAWTCRSHPKIEVKVALYNGIQFCWEHHEAKFCPAAGTIVPPFDIVQFAREYADCYQIWTWDDYYCGDAPAALEPPFPGAIWEEVKTQANWKNFAWNCHWGNDELLAEANDNDEPWVWYASNLAWEAETDPDSPLYKARLFIAMYENNPYVYVLQQNLSPAGLDASRPSLRVQRDGAWHELADGGEKEHILDNADWVSYKFRANGFH